MKTIQIEFDSNGLPKVDPDPVGCKSGETLGFLLCSKTAIIEAVNLACDEANDDIFTCATGTRQNHCKVDLLDTNDPKMPKGNVIWAVAPEHTSKTPRLIKYSIMPFVGKSPYEPGELDPLIVVTKRP